ncbi:hypothetical protein EHQ27_05930 [Leptospira wolffii]|uniref:hypothetical protein n=1 Tax=Leptospira wolffii TaxID=409998 RepID=UPI001083DE5B|nr:hypothetical protein [Leptospira wolffii]TGK61518.1 hypothetical protein EHQ32_01255 [Leptospira wolffii]TGK70062.1 hypothetical protein EHQ35_16670 [Leptospira wolffii]TGK74993.1 hypothetical protein EHQ27_05930 [Leptospira wolffii]TGL31163.1 hypothetical protein EHQ57_07140 [Leptospira wolffii]
MDYSEAENLVKNINTEIRKFPWMDFEVNQYSNSVLEVKGGIDLLAKPNIVISFLDVFSVSMPFSWQTETKKDVFLLLEGLEEREMNLHFKVEQGNYWFKFIPERYQEGFGCYIVARNVEFRLLAET